MKRPHPLGIWLLVCTLAVAARGALAQDDEDEEFVQLPPGVKAVYEAVDGRVLLERMEPLPRLSGSSPHPKVPSDGFRATWSGVLAVPYDGEFTFALDRSSLQGVKLTIDGEPARPGEPVELWFGNAPFELSGVHPGGAAEFELFWEHEFFDREPVPPRVFGHRPETAQSEAIARQRAEDAGAVLAQSLGCFRCHGGPHAWLGSLAEGLDPGLLLPGPRLAGVSGRVHRAWLADYLADPAAHRSGTRMPACFDDTSADREALETIAAYLTSGQTEKIASARPGGSPTAGEKLYTACGCAACHEPPEGSAAGPAAAPSLDRLAEKWTAVGLAGFLADPLSLRPHGRMPDFNLASREARDLAAYLLSRQAAGSPPKFVGLPEVDQPHPGNARTLVDPTEQVLWLPLDEPAGKLIDASGSGHHGSVEGHVEYAREGRHGLALGFDGEGGHLVIDGSESLDTNRDFTWAAWIKTDAAGAIFGRAPREGNWPHGGKTLFVLDGKLSFDVGWVGVVRTKTKVNDGGWHHVAVTVDRNTEGKRDTVVLYVDGRESARRADWDVQKFPEDDFVLKLGTASPNFPRKGRYRGLIDQAAMWSRTLDAEEIVALAEESFHLAATEAALFTPGQLRSQWTRLGGDPAALDRLAPGLRLRAVALGEMAARGCLDCHDPGTPLPEGIEPGRKGPALTGVDPSRMLHGCLAEDAATGRSPRFALSDAERAALVEYVGSLPARQFPSPAEAISVEMGLLGCTACHQDQAAGAEPLTSLLGGPDAAKFILPPSLTGVARRLLPERLDSFVREGAGPRRLRPWTGARMPGFGPRGGRLVRGLAIRDGVDPPPPPGKEPQRPRPAVPGNQLELGRLLVSNKGLTCVNCHEINGHQPTGEADPSTRAPDLGLVASHIRRDYLRRLLTDPNRVFPGTKMPVTFPKIGPPPAPGLEELPKEALFGALWNYLSLGRDAPGPREEEPAQVLPDVFRVYVQRGPTYVGERLIGRGVACGFPTGTLLFDADRLEPAAVWFDGFLNRVPTNYFGLNWRAPKAHEPLARPEASLAFRRDGGPWVVPPRPLECDPNTESRFDGYTVGRSHVTFRYRLAVDGRQVPVTDTVRIDHRDTWHGFAREIAVDGLPQGTEMAWAGPPGERFSLVTPDGKPAGRATGPQDAPLALYRNGGKSHAVRVDAPTGWQWQPGPDGTFRLAGRAVSNPKPVRLRVGRWTYTGTRPEPSPEELATLAEAEDVLAPAPADHPPQKPQPPARPVSTSTTTADEPFAYKLEPIPGPPEGWRPSGVAFAPDGTLYACGLTEGRVYRAQLPPVHVPEDFHWELYATGLNVPTGMAVVDGRLLVAHRPEVTELIDADADNTVETFRTVMGPWSLKDGFHEYAFGLAVDPGKRLYVALNNGYFWRYGGPTNRGRHRSDVMRCDLDGHSEMFGHGCRVPNGISRGPGDGIFFADNQGDWIQVNKIVHCRKGVFYGHPETEDEFLPEGEVPDALPAVWLPYNVIRSAAALCYDGTDGAFGPFAGQMFVGDVGYGQSANLMRVALEEVDGVWQGAAFRFLDDQPRGPQFARFGPDGHLYICCLTDGLVRMRFGGRMPMEIHHVAMRRDGRGFTLHFTKPLAAEADVSPETVRARRWYYPYGIRYGSPRYEEVDVPIQRVEVAADRRSIDVELPIKTYKNCMVYYFNVGKLRSADGELVGHPEAWYTVQRVWK